MLKKKIFKTAIGCALLAGLSTTAALGVGNVSNSDYTFEFSNTSGDISYTEARQKLDYTSAYMKFNWVQDGGGYFDVKVVDINRNDFSRVWPYGPYGEYTPLPSETYLSNYAAEDRGIPVSVRLLAIGTSGAAYGGLWHAGGVWSPDSV